MSNKSKAILWLFWGVANFLVFAYDIQNDRDFWTWIWLLFSQIYILGSLRFWIAHDRQQNSLHITIQIYDDYKKQSE